MTTMTETAKMMLVHYAGKSALVRQLVVDEQLTANEGEGSLLLMHEFDEADENLLSVLVDQVRAIASAEETIMAEAARIRRDMTTVVDQIEAGNHLWSVSRQETLNEAMTKRTILLEQVKMTLYVIAKQA